jgi:hypothetical protein
MVVEQFYRAGLVRELRRVAVGAFVLATTVGCGTAVVGEDVTEAVETTTSQAGGALQLDLPDGFALESVVVAANGRLDVNDRARVNGANGLGLVVNAGTGTTTLGADAAVGDLLGGGAMTLRDRSFVSRNVQSGGVLTRQNGVVVSGTISERVPLRSLVNRSWLVVFSDSATSVNLTSGQTKVLSPGTYTNVTANGGSKLTLKAGTYNINSLKLEPQSTLTLDTSAGAVIVNVKNELIYRGTVPNRQSVAGKALFGYFGSTMVSVDAPFAGTLVAPNATIKLESLNGATHYGAFFGKNVEVHQGGNVVHQPFTSWASLPFVNDGLDPIAEVPADSSIVRSGDQHILTYSLKAPLLLDLTDLPIRRVPTLPSGVEINFGGNIRCVQRLGLPGMDCIDYPPRGITPIPVLIVRRLFSDDILRHSVDLRNIFRCTTDICPFSSADMFRRAGKYEAVKRQMKWQYVSSPNYDLSSDSIKRPWAEWSEASGVVPNQRDFLLALNDAASWLGRSDRFTNFRGQPETALTATGSGAEQDDNDEGRPTYYVEVEDAWRLYVSWIAHNVALDTRRALPWTLDDMAAGDEGLLAPLFDSTEMMFRRPTDDFGLAFGPHGNYYDVPWASYHGYNMIGMPRFTYRFLAQNEIIQESRLDSIKAMLDWSANLVHFYGDATRVNALSHWGHRYFPTVDLVINGTVRAGESEPKHWTMGCHGTSFFIKDVLRAINIPVRVPFICEHAEMAFVSEGLFVDHGDNPYNSNYTGSQCGADHLLIDAATFAERFGRQVNHNDASTCEASPTPVGYQASDEGIASCQ